MSEAEKGFGTVKLSKEQQQLVLAEIEIGWLRSEVFYQSPKWLVQMVGGEDLNALGEYAVVRSGASYSASDNPGVPFGAYARQIVRREFNKLRIKMARRSRVWFTMKQAEDDRGSPVPIANFLHDHRRQDSVTLLSLWHSSEYAEQRKFIDPRGRIVLYLRTVEGWTFEEMSATFGVSKQAVQQIYARVEHQLGQVRIKKAITRQLAGRTA